jgi:hypothetical protein
LPLQFRVLYRQFLLRVVDLEALSAQADVVGFLGQFAGVLIMVSIIHFVSAAMFLLSMPWRIEDHLVSTTMLVSGLIAVLCWESTFPDRRDVMVLAPLPVAPRTILFAKVAAFATILGIAVAALNVASGLLCPFLLGSRHSSPWGFFQSFAAYWFTMCAASAFPYCAVLTVQGVGTLLLPRRLFLRLSALLQLAAFVLFVAVFFLEPSPKTLADLRMPQTQWMLASSPSYWFLAMLNQLDGSLPPELDWLALRAWIGLNVVVAGAVASLLLCYLRTMKKTVEEPDLVPGAGGLHWRPRIGSSLATALVQFSFRSLIRSRQHRVAFAFYLSLVFAIALSVLQGELGTKTPIHISSQFFVPSFLMMSLAVFGLRSVFALPISLTANWLLRATQIRASEKYIGATRFSLLLFAVLPVWLIAALLSLRLRPLSHVAIHLVVLALVGWLMAELSLINFRKVPFTCSYLPGKVNVQVVFWGFIVVVMVVTSSFAEYEQRALGSLSQTILMAGALCAGILGLSTFNRKRAKEAVLYFEETPEEIITTLGLRMPTHAAEPKAAALPQGSAAPPQVI